MNWHQKSVRMSATLRPNNKTHKRCTAKQSTHRSWARCCPGHCCGPSPCRADHGRETHARHRRRNGQAHHHAPALSFGDRRCRATGSPWPILAWARPAAKTTGSGDGHGATWLKCRPLNNRQQKQCCHPGAIQASLSPDAYSLACHTGCTNFALSSVAFEAMPWRVTAAGIATVIHHLIPGTMG